VSQVWECHGSRRRPGAFPGAAACSAGSWRDPARRCTRLRHGAAPAAGERARGSAPRHAASCLTSRASSALRAARATRPQRKCGRPLGPPCRACASCRPGATPGALTWASQQTWRRASEMDKGLIVGRRGFRVVGQAEDSPAYRLGLPATSTWQAHSRCISEHACARRRRQTRFAAHSSLLGDGRFRRCCYKRCCCGCFSGSGISRGRCCGRRHLGL
jgi:hypothetical protein